MIGLGCRRRASPWMPTTCLKQSSRIKWSTWSKAAEQRINVAIVLSLRTGVLTVCPPSIEKLEIKILILENKDIKLSIKMSLISTQSLSISTYPIQKQECVSFLCRHIELGINGKSSPSPTCNNYSGHSGQCNKLYATHWHRYNQLLKLLWLKCWQKIATLVADSTLAFI